MASLTASQESSPSTDAASASDTGLESVREMLFRAWDTCYEKLDGERAGAVHWTGELSTSALSTATAISALVQVQRSKSVGGTKVDTQLLDSTIDTACHWLLNQQNEDGGFGDTNRSHSNIATTYLVLAAWKSAGFDAQATAESERAWTYVKERGEWSGLRARYGKDKTFVVPILSSCALAGLVPWKKVPALPFEAAWLPQDWYRLARMPVVSYAIPALVAIGQARFHFAPPKNPLLKALRSRAVEPTLRVLERMQPASGGYLEATPLTSFVLMNLAAMGKGETKVARKCIKFLVDSRLEDGSWPIDTNLATWVTSLSLAAMSRPQESLPVENDRRAEVAPDRTAAENEGNEKTSPTKETTLLHDLHRIAVPEETIRWLLRCQHTSKHPFTGANPGGWGWTDLSGAVPDADDTPGALIALSKLDLQSPRYARLKHEVHLAAARGLMWLCRLQNRDGGWPTFCRGWGKLPFDRSGSDLTAHALRAIHAWLPSYAMLESVGAVAGISFPSRTTLTKASQRGLRYLARQQAMDGSWLPLWFGNQDREEEDNPIYGTSKVLIAYAELGALETEQAQASIRYLEGSQNLDGGWGGGPSVPYECQAVHKTGDSNRADGGFATQPNKSPIPSLGEGKAYLTEEVASEKQEITSVRSTVEETGLALEALILAGGQLDQNATIMRGLRWLTEVVSEGNLECSFPIGFYFAKLWYHERLYPAIFSLAAIGTAIRRLDADSPLK